MSAVDEWLRSREGRCTHGYDLGTQHPQLCSCVGEAARDAAFEATEGRLTDEQKASVDQAISLLNRRRQPWSANDLRPMLPGVPLSVMGGRITSAARRGLIRATGDRVPSTLPSTHAHELKVWEAA